MTPKSLLRNPQVTSTLDDLATGQFEVVLDEVSSLNKQQVERVILCSGKVYYDLLEMREKENIKGVAIVRLEQFYPVCKKKLTELYTSYGAKEWIWVQEEPKNMGAWQFVCANLDFIPFSCVSRDASASTAVGNSKLHAKEQQALLEQALKIS